MYFDYSWLKNYPSWKTQLITIFLLTDIPERLAQSIFQSRVVYLKSEIERCKNVSRKIKIQYTEFSISDEPLVIQFFQVVKRAWEKWACTSWNQTRWLIGADEFIFGKICTSKSCCIKKFSRPSKWSITQPPFRSNFMVCFCISVPQTIQSTIYRKYLASNILHKCSPNN